MGLLGSVDNAFAYKMIIFAMAILFLMPTFISIYTTVGDDEQVQDLLDEYKSFTGTKPTNEAVWCLTGIYTPYAGGSAYGYTDDGWLYGSKVSTYTPSQYRYTSMEYSVSDFKEITDDTGKVTNTTYYDTYRYTVNTSNGDKKADDIYTAVAMDVNQKSSIFFTSGGKVEEGDFFYYEYNGYRYAFQPLADYTGQNSAGEAIPVSAVTTSLSLIWYDYYGNQGISGQLVLSGSDSGVAYLTATDIIRSFDSTTSTSKFTMMFNGVNMNVYIRLNPYYVAQYSVQDCFNLGYWEIMVSSLSTDVNAYLDTSYEFNPSKIFDVMIKLFTFNAADLGLSGWTATLASIIISIPLYAALLSIGMSFYPVLILAGILAAIQSITSIF